MLFLDGAYTFRGTKASFHRARRLQPDELAKLLASLSRRIVRLLERRGLLIADPQHPVLEFDVGSALDQIQAASVKYCIAVGPHAGRKALTLYSVPPVDDSTGCGLLAQVAGFSLHAATVCEAHQRSKLERLCRYITRPPIATKRLSLDRRGRVVYQYKRPFRDGSTHVVLEPLDFIARRAALVPRPRLNLTRSSTACLPRTANTGNASCRGANPKHQSPASRWHPRAAFQFFATIEIPVRARPHRCQLSPSISNPTCLQARFGWLFFLYPGWSDIHEQVGLDAEDTVYAILKPMGQMRRSRCRTVQGCRRCFARPGTDHHKRPSR